MRLEISIAKKYFYPHNKDFFRRISLVSVVTVFISVFLPLFILGVLGGFHNSIVQKMISKDFHVQVYDTSDKLFDYQDIIDNVEDKFPGTKGIPYFEGGAIISRNLLKTSVMVRGIPESADFSGEFPIIDGSWQIKPSTVLLGASLARKIKTGAGDVIQLFLRPYAGYSQPNQQESQNLTQRKFRVGGIFQTGYDEIDSNMIFMSFDKAREIYNYGNRAWGIGFFSDDLEKLPNIKAQIKNLNFYLQVRDWEDTNRNILKSFTVERVLIMVVLVIIIIATLLSVYIGLNVVVADRRKDIGILKTMGFTPRRIENVFFIKGLFISVISISLGTLF
ncbi:MAG: hypothetical protein CVV50_02985, partial [Spirochaetae bacterium HGW-Spirochaetae-6]